MLVAGLPQLPGRCRDRDPEQEPGDESDAARFLGLAVPGGLENYLERLSDLMVNEPVCPPADMTPVMALMARYGTFPPPAPSGDAD